MGFTPEPTTIKLNFKDTELDGLTITTKSCTVKEFNQFIRWSLTDVSKGEDPVKSNEAIEELFASKLIEWNLEIPAGRPVPTTLAGVRRLDSNIFARILLAWQRGLTSVPTKPQPQSNNGALPDRSEESMLGLDQLSQSPGN